MASLLLAVIYIAFISLGLPDSILGSAWPSMYVEMNAPISYAGVITMIIAGGTIVSSLMSGRLVRRLGPGLVTAVSVAMTAVALFGFSLSSSFAALCAWSIPYGLGAGGVDAALNNFVALHYKSRHMNWLHCFWGVGATAGPYIMGLYLAHGFRWNSGYRLIGFIQAALVICLFLSLPLWKRKQYVQKTQAAHLGILNVLRIPGAIPAMICFFCYCSLETSAGLWAASYMVIYKGIDAQTAAKWASLFYLGITAGRLLSGFISDRFGDRNMVRAGQLVAALGAVLLLLPVGSILTFTGLVMVGLGCAPIYPGLLHATPANFGAEITQSVIGIEMASAYVGTTFMPLVFGAIAGEAHIQLYPAYLLLFVALMAVMAERLNLLRKRDINQN
jgi:fucose permease